MRSLPTKEAAMPTRFVLLVVFALAPLRGTAAPPEIAELPGPVVIAGGEKLPDSVRDEFVMLAGKAEAKIVVIAGGDAKADEVLKPWKETKASSVVVLQAKDKKQADDPAFAKPLADATGVWIVGRPADAMLDLYRGTAVEKELKKLHARGGAVGGQTPTLTDLVVTGGPGPFAWRPGFGFLPGFVLNYTSDAPGSWKPLARALPERPGYVGLAVGEQSAVVIRGRLLRVAGDSPVTLVWAAGAGHPVARQDAKADAVFDLFQLRRAAANRAAKDPFPPAKPMEPVVEKGSLVIVGGGGAGPDIWKRFIELAGGPDAPIVVIPTSLDDPIPKTPAEVAILRRYGAKHVEVLHTRSRTEADDPKFSEALTKAKGVWFGGGRQWRFVDSYEGTLTEKRIHEVLARGGAIGGSSAGASIQSEYMPRGHPLGNTVMAAEGYERGFGFLPGCAVDQHFFARKRTAHMTELMKEYPQYLGIGIDEGTAIVVTGSTAEVIGRTKVAFYDTRKKPAGEKDYEEVKVGERYDLKKREKVK
jgi:cyanophycinase